jgi:hypothetical protein
MGPTTRRIGSSVLSGLIFDWGCILRLPLGEPLLEQLKHMSPHLDPLPLVPGMLLSGFESCKMQSLALKPSSGLGTDLIFPQAQPCRPRSSSMGVTCGNEVNQFPSLSRDNGYRFPGPFIFISPPRFFFGDIDSDAKASGSNLAIVLVFWLIIQEEDSHANRMVYRLNTV